MKKYRINILPPKAKRMKGSGKIVINVADKEEVFDVGDVMNFDFEMPEDIPWIHNNRIIDGTFFDIQLVYTNKDGTRKEVIKPVPEELS